MNHTIIITTVGTSMFTNYKGGSAYQKSWEKIKKQPYKEWDAFEEDIEQVQTDIEKWVQFSCAELQTLENLQKRYTSGVQTYLVTSDTIAGHLAGEILEKLLPSRNIIVQELKKINDFDVLSKDKFKIRRGFDNYVKYLIQTYAEGFNISGGYKAIIPITTLIASLKNNSLFYNFEDSEMLIEIPPFPYDWKIERFQKFEEFFKEIESEGGLSIDSVPYKTFLDSIPLQEDQKLLQTLTLIEDDLIIESEIGRIYRKAYENEKEVEIIKTKISPENKQVSLANHHSKDLLSQFWDKIKKSPYVNACVCSIKYQSKSTKLISRIYANGEIDIVLHRTLKGYKSDAGYAMKIKTTGRDIRETKKIADILEEEYDK